VHEHQLRTRPAYASAGRDMDGWRPRKHGEMPRDPDGIRQVPAVQRSPERGRRRTRRRRAGRDLQAAARRVGSTSAPDALLLKMRRRDVPPRADRGR
jgi:hypothetical protein